MNNSKNDIDKDVYKDFGSRGTLDLNHDSVIGIVFRGSKELFNKVTNLIELEKGTIHYTKLEPPENKLWIKVYTPERRLNQPRNDNGVILE